MTAMDDTAHKVEGFGLGAVDYITKPIQREELLARIQHHLQLHRLQKELSSKSEDLAQKNAELEAYGHTIAHSLKTPLAAANRFLEILYQVQGRQPFRGAAHLAAAGARCAGHDRRSRRSAAPAVDGRAAKRRSRSRWTWAAWSGRP